MSPGSDLESGDLAGVVLKSTNLVEIPTVTWRALVSSHEVGRHRQVDAFRGVAGLTVRSRDERPLPLQVDGDYIGEAPAAVFRVVPRALTVVS